MSQTFNDHGVVDQDALRDAKRVPTCEVVAKLFPGHPVKRRGVFRSPFRDDRNPSFSPYLGHGGDWLWKDHATGESGDNVTLYRKAFPELSYQQAVDGLCRLVLGRPGLREGAIAQPSYGRAAAPRKRSQAPVKEVEQQLVQKVVFACGLGDGRVPQEFRDYWRSRGISDEVILRYCEYVCFENANRKGGHKVDPVSGIPLVDNTGNAVVDDGIRYGIGMRNDIGGYAIRVPDTPQAEGYKTNTSSFIATFLFNGARPMRQVSMMGQGDGYVNYLRYEPHSGLLWTGPSQCFVGLRPDVVPFAMPFLEGFVGERLYERELMGVCSVLDALSAPLTGRGVVVEGMFDGLSQRELQRIRGFQASGEDLVVLNSVGNAKWAVPFLARHEQVVLMLDNDLKSGAGQKTADMISQSIAEYNRRLGNRTVVFNGSLVFSGYKDLNDALKASKGFPEQPEKPKAAKPKKRSNNKGVTTPKR